MFPRVIDRISTVILCFKKQMYLSQKIGANLVRFVTSVHVANIFKVSNICKSPQKNLHAFAGEDEDSKAQHF